jgi:hypothetical protein
VLAAVTALPDCVQPAIQSMLLLLLLLLLLLWLLAACTCSTAVSA